MEEHKYYEQVNVRCQKRIKEKLKELPPYCKDYFISLESQMEPRTRMAYLYDLCSYFEFIRTEVLQSNMALREISLSIVENIRPSKIEEYLSYLRLYEKNGKTYTNSDRGLKRKLASLRTFYAYYYNSERISNNPAIRVKMPKIHQKPIVRLIDDEIRILLNEVESGSNLSARQKAFHEKTKVRDMAVMTLLLGTGIRVSELVGIDIRDMDLYRELGCKVHRKGGDEAVVYFSKEVATALIAYYEERKQIVAQEGSTEAFFLSIRNERLSIRAVETLVKKYSDLVVRLGKNITPHKLRSTYGTALYRKSSNILLVSDALGNSISVASRYYVDSGEENRKLAPSYI